MTSITTTLKTLIASDAKARVAQEKTGTRLFDELRAQGIRSTDLKPHKREGSTATPEFEKAYKAAIVAGFDASVQKLLALPIAAVPEKNKPMRKYWQQQIGSYLAAHERALRKREEAASERAPTTPKSGVEKLRDAMSMAEKIVQGTTEWGMDVDDFLRDLRALNKRIC